MGEPSRSCHGEGHARGAGSEARRGSPRGMDGGTCARRRGEQERPVCAALVGAKRAV